MNMNKTDLFFNPGNPHGSCKVRDFPDPDPECNLGGRKAQWH